MNPNILTKMLGLPPTFLADFQGFLQGVAAKVDSFEKKLASIEERLAKIEENLNVEETGRTDGGD